MGHMSWDMGIPIRKCHNGLFFYKKVLNMTLIKAKKTLAIPYMYQQVETWKFYGGKGHEATSDAHHCIDDDNGEGANDGRMADDNDGYDARPLHNCHVSGSGSGSGNINGVIMSDFAAAAASACLNAPPFSCQIWISMIILCSLPYVRYSYDVTVLYWVTFTQDYSRTISRLLWKSQR